MKKHWIARASVVSFASLLLGSGLSAALVRDVQASDGVVSGVVENYDGEYTNGLSPTTIRGLVNSGYTCTTSGNTETCTPPVSSAGTTGTGSAPTIVGQENLNLATTCTSSGGGVNCGTASSSGVGAGYNGSVGSTASTASSGGDNGSEGGAPATVTTSTSTSTSSTSSGTNGGGDSGSVGGGNAADSGSPGSTTIATSGGGDGGDSGGVGSGGGATTPTSTTQGSTTSTASTNTANTQVCTQSGSGNTICTNSPVTSITVNPDAAPTTNLPFPSAADGGSILGGWNTTNQLTKFECKNVTNDSTTGLAVYVPQAYAIEYASFKNGPPPHVTLGPCGGAVGGIVIIDPPPADSGTLPVADSGTTATPTCQTTCQQVGSSRFGNPPTQCMVSCSDGTSGSYTQGVPGSYRGGGFSDANGDPTGQGATMGQDNAAAQAASQTGGDPTGGDSTGGDSTGGDSSGGGGGS